MLGATGVMGRRIAGLARRALPGVEVVGASRRSPAQPGGSQRRIDLHDPAALAAGLAGVDCVVNAVGPYLYEPAPLVTACVRAGAHYADLAEEPAFLAAVAAAARAAGAAEAGLCVVPGCSTVPGLVELLAGAWHGRGDVAALRVWLSLGSRNPVGPGLLLGLLRPLGRRAADGTRCFGEPLRHAASDGVVRVYGRYPTGFVDDRIQLGHRSVPLLFHTGFDRTWLTRALIAAAPLLSRLGDRTLARLARVALPAAALVRPLGTPRGHFRMEALDADGGVRAALEVQAERDGLDVPALPAVWVARRLHEGAPSAAGCLRLADLVPLEVACAALREAGLALRGLP